METDLGATIQSASNQSDAFSVLAYNIGALAAREFSTNTN
eukprot:CAMPEP_0194374016 /NCGR_PEP_ID=MMETSP0174-20130528/22385_1 /TAXON_ID=216777 /ORGANISM="Proboscia alata, Strain PI-D3" /LENGTH=39 /DNA_ID= /DNA_START= /DNA_END= /DNA_ORIENTATION=